MDMDHGGHAPEGAGGSSPDHEDGRRLTSFERDGLVFDVVDRGPLGGETVVLLHGFPQTSSSWDLLAPLLHAQGYRTLAPDQRGYSPRARPRGRFAYRMSQLAEDVAALIEAAGPAAAGRTSSDTTGAPRSPGRWPPPGRRRWPR